MSRLGLALALFVAATSTARADDQTAAPANTPTNNGVPASDGASATAPAGTSGSANDGSPASVPGNAGSPASVLDAGSPATAPATEAATTPASDSDLPSGGTSRRLNSLHTDIACRDCTYHAPPDLKDQGMGASVGIVTGGRVTPGGLRVEGHYLYQLADADWFDGAAAFTFGGGGAACFRDRENEFMCDHGLAAGKGVEITAAVRHFFAGSGKFWPFVRAGVGVSIVRYSDDEVTGLAIPLHAGAGMRTSLTPQVALTVLAELELGFGRFNHALGWEPQAGAAISAGVEFGL